MSTPQVDDPRDMPALYRSANTESLAAQESFLRWLRIRVLSLVLAAAAGIFTWKVASYHLGGVASFVLFAVAIGAELYLAISRPDRVWYEGRAAAESAKTLSWRYMVGGRSFESGVRDADTTFRRELIDVLHDLDALQPAAHAPNDTQITDKMREIRGLSFDERRSVYLKQRIQDQVSWYGNKSRFNARRANLWVGVGVVFEILGLIGGALKAFGAVDVDSLGVLASAAAGAATWLQAKQHQNLATAYSVTSQELAEVASEIAAAADEAVWPQLVADAEEAISREHTLWRASRGVRIRNRRTTMQ